MSGTYPAPILNVIATGSTTARLLSDRVGDVVNVLDWGVVHDPGAAHVTANSLAYQAALNAANGRVVILPVGISIVHTQLSINHPVELIINGTMLLAPTAAGQTIYSSILINTSNVTIRLGVGAIIDGNKANQLGTLYSATGSGAGITTAQNPGAIDSPLPTLGVTRFSDIYVYGPGTIQNTWSWPVAINNTYRCKVVGLRMLNAGYAPGVNDGTHEFEWAYNYTAHIPDYGFAAYQGCYDGSFHHNICDDVDTVGVLNDGGVSTGYNTWPAHNIQIHNNIVSNTHGSGCVVISSSAGGSAAWHYDIDIYANQFINCATTNGGSILNVNGARNVSIRHNLVSGGGNATTAYNSGIAVNNSVTVFNTVIENNIIENMVPGSSSTFGIWVGGPGLICRNNVIRDTRTTPLMPIGMFDTCGTGTVITGNVITNMTAGAYAITTISDTIFLDGSIDNWAKPKAIGNVTPNTGAFTTLSANAGLSIQGGSYAAGTWNTDSNWGGFYKARSGAIADFAVSSSSGNTGLKMVASGLVSLPFGIATSALTTVTTATYTVLATDNTLVLNPSAGLTLTLTSAAANLGRILSLKLVSAFAVSSASANVIPQAGGAAGTAILAGTAGKWCTMQSDGTNWQIMMSN